MGFFSILEIFFFLSLGITFILIIMLVYHFKGRLVALEDKYHIMFDIMNSMVKEMKILRDTMITIKSSPNNTQEQTPQSFGNSGSGFPMDLMKLFQGGGSQMFPSNKEYIQGDDDEDDDDDDDDYKRIVVSDTELDSDSENETDIKIISVNINENEKLVSLADLEDEENLIDKLDINEEFDQEENDQEENDKDNDEYTEKEYKKMDLSYLRTMVLTRGLATDTKKMKKNDLIKLLNQSVEILG